MIAAALVLVLGLLPQTPGPRLVTLQPAGATVGSEVTVSWRGERLADAQALLFDRPGIEVGAIDAAKKDQGSAVLRVAADCGLGAFALRVRTPTGLSNPLLFHVGRLPSVAEARDGDRAQRVPLNCTIDGSLRDGEVDRYEVEVPAFVDVHVEVEAMRLGMVALDTSLRVRGPAGDELARADDSALGGRDPWLTFRSPTAGVVTIELQPAVPGDGRLGSYRLHVGTFPRPFGALPCGGRAGEVLELSLLEGDGTVQPWRGARVMLPDDGSERFAWYPEVEGGTSPTPIWLQVGGPPNQLPRCDEKGAWLELPASVHGVVWRGDEAVSYRWRGEKGKEVEFRVVARALRSALDPVLTVRAADGRFLANNDDTGGFDSVLRFTPPADGEFVVDVRDLLRRGSPQHFFRLEAGARERAPRLGQQVSRGVDPSVVVPRAAGGALVVLGNGVDAAAVLQLGELPPGCTATVGPRLPGSNTVAVLFTAAADAPLAASQLQLGLATPGGLDARPFLQPLSLLTGRNDVPLLQTMQRAVPLAVVEPVPFQVAATTPLVPVVRGASLPVALALQRTAPFAGRVRVRAAWLPPGLSAGQAAFDKDATTATLPIEAAGNAPCGEFPCLLVATVRVDNATIEVALPFVTVRVDEPWLDIARGTARGRQGQAATLHLVATDKRPRPAAATATLRGLPRGVTAAEASLPANASELVFELQLAADAAPGRHKDLSVDVMVADAEGRPVLHRFPAGELRVDKAPAAGGRP